MRLPETAPRVSLRGSRCVNEGPDGLMGLVNAISLRHYTTPMRHGFFSYIHRNAKQACRGRNAVRDYINPKVAMSIVIFCDGTGLVTILDTKQNAHMKWAFATSLDGLGVGCAGKI